MSDDIIKEMKKLERSGGEHRMEIGLDEKGYVDKECPRKKCAFVFKVNSDDWGALFKDEAVYCPKCREEAPADHWWTTEQLEEADRRTSQQAMHMFDQALRRGVKAHNRRQPRNSFISMTMTVKGAKTRRPVNLPMSARDVLEQELKCEECGARFALVGIGYFCPCCGHNSVLRTFSASMKKVQTKLSSLDLIREGLADALSVDDIETTCQSMVETCFNDCVMAFQRVLEKLYVSVPGTSQPRMNIFQGLKQGSELWEAVFGETYEHWLGTGDYDLLHKLFQQRHLLCHQEGMVDQKYVDTSGDSTYFVGQRLVVGVGDAAELARLVQVVVNGVREEMSKRGLV